LTQPLFWDSYWESIPIPNRVDPGSNHVLRSMDRLLVRHLPRGAGLRFLEVGCAPGRWLLYFSERFGYTALGCDTSRTGLRLTRKNLELCGGRPGAVFESSTESIAFAAESLDVVASFGLIEHFGDPWKAIGEQVRLVKPGGYLVLSMPNYGGLNGLLYRLFDPAVLGWHNRETMTRGFLEEVGRRWSLETLVAAPIGGWTPADYSFRRPRGLAPALGLVRRLLARVRQPLVGLDHLNSAWFSGYWMAIYRRPGG